jgi:hypothetical protein
MLSKILLDFYFQKKVDHHFKADEKYLSSAFEAIEKIWKHNYNQINSINYVMLSEAPLWGINKNYIYNPKVNNTQFFYRSDLEHCVKEKIKDKVAFISKLNAIGFIILDISPFPLNEKGTTINYRAISTKDYKILLNKTLPLYFARKLSLISEKKSENMKIFYRYGRVKKAFNNLIAKIILEKGLINSENEIFDISQRGGGVNKIKLGEIINETTNKI